MKVLMCASAYPPDIRGGGEISTALIAGGLARKNVDLSVLTFTKDLQPGQTVRREKVDGVDLVRMKCPNVYWSIDSAKAGNVDKLRWHLSQSFRPYPPLAIQQQIELLKPDLIHTSTIEDFGAGLWRWAMRRGIPCIHTLRSYNLIHHYGTLYDPATDREIGRDILSYSKRFYANSLNGVIGISDYILQRHRAEGFFEDAKTTVISNPIDHSIEDVAVKTDGPVRLGVLGRVMPEKGISQWIDSLVRIDRDIPWKLSIAGTGPDDYTQTLKAKTSGLPVKFLGWTESRPFLKQLDLLVVPSRWHEPFGRIVVEAFSIGLPVLCLHRGGLSELVTSGVTGWVLDEWDTASIEHAISHCRNLDRRVIRREAEKYTIENIASQHLKFYQRVISSEA